MKKSFREVNKFSFSVSSSPLLETKIYPISTSILRVVMFYVTIIIYASRSLNDSPIAAFCPSPQSFSFPMDFLIRTGSEIVN